ncbi:MAG: alpha/beta fold hydrolase [Pseudomonadota bacterium]
MSHLVAYEHWAGPGQLFRLNVQTAASRAPVLMTHGTFSTAETMTPMAMALAAAGHPVWIIEWRGRKGRPGAFDFYDLAEGEITQALAAIDEPAHLLAHSGGGLAMCFALLDPINRARVRSLTLLATQGTRLTEAPRLRYAGVRAMDLLGRVFGRWPRALTRIGPCDETAKLLSQWVTFNRARRVSTRDGRDVFACLSALELPVFALSGAADLTIARPDGCRELAYAFGPRARYHCCAAATDGEDFTHARLIRSRAAAHHVWPRITAFLQELELGPDSAS